MNDRQVVEQIIILLGGVQNVAAVTNCMTRLRVVVKDEAGVREDRLRSAEKVLGVVHDIACSYEIVVGPGNSRKYADICHEELGLPSAISKNAPGAGNSAMNGSWKENKAVLREGQKKSKAKQMLKMLGDIFVPLIPGIIAAGLCAGFAALIGQLIPDYKEIHFWYIAHLILSSINVSFMTYITGWAGYRAAERFGATPILGGMLGMVTSLSNIDEIAKNLGLYNLESPLDSILKSGKGGVLAVICGAFVLAKVEKIIRKRMPASLDIVITPLLTLLIVVVPYILCIMPALGFVSNGIVWVFGKVCMSESLIIRIIVGYLSAAIFLPLVASGMHHGLVALYSVQLQQLGFVTLYPALAMAGAGQVGAAIALYGKAKRVKHQKLRSVIKGALPAGLLGVGEPLIYGVTLPMGKPFLTAGLGAGFGGAFVVACQVASTTWGPSGLLGVFVMTAGPGGAVKSMLFYLIGLCISYVMSYFITKALITDKEVAEALGGIPAEALGGEIADEEVELPADGVISHISVRHGDAVQFGFSPAVCFEHVIKDPVGIHARPAGKIAELVKESGCEVTVKNGDRSASGSSVLELMMLGAVNGSRLEISVTGDGSKKAAQLLREFMDEKL